MGTSAILPPAKRQFEQNSEEDKSADRRHRKTISRVMDAIVGSVKCFLGALFENPKKEQMSKAAPLMRENTSRQEDWIQYDCYTSDPIDIATSVTRPKRRDVRNRNVNEEVVEMEEEEEENEEFSSTEEDEPNVGKRLRRNRTGRRSRQRTNRASRNNFEHFGVFFME